MKELESLLEKTVTGLGYEFVGMQWIPQNRSAILRLFIDKPPDGVNIDDCAKTSRHLARVLDVEGILKTKYFLEVSSPGLDRPLFKLEDYAKFVGTDADIKLKSLVDNRRKFTGQILAVTENGEISFKTGEEEILINFADIKSANLVLGVKL